MAMARDGLMPKCIANVSETYGTPVNASILTWALTGVLTLVFDIGILAQMVSIGTLTIFCGVNLALLVRRYTPKDVRFDDMNARWPALSRALYLLIACLSLCFSVTYELELVLQILSAIAVCYTILSFHLYGLKTFPQTNGFCNAPNTQTQFTAPFVPLFPSLGVLATSQLIVSLGSLAHVRFALVCLIALASYVAMDYVRCCEYYEIPSEEEEEKA
jgi:APA family basic amino acid/polyamine antiporter